MFDNVNLTKAYTLEDLYGNSVEVCTFNATLSRKSGISVNMIINRVELYEKHKDEILISYREFNADLSAIAVTMGLAESVGAEPSALHDWNDVREEVKTMALEVFTQVIESLGDVVVNPVPMYDQGVRY
jgi:hypothetical protein